jgi:hypothetical protein
VGKPLATLEPGATVTRHLSACLVALALVLALPGCVSPSVPVPPPGTEVMSFAVNDAAGTVTYSATLGSNWANSWVIVLVEETGEGVVARSDAAGNVTTAPFVAMPDNTALIRFEREDGETAGVCVVIRAGQLNDNDQCGP